MKGGGGADFLGHDVKDLSCQPFVIDTDRLTGSCLITVSVKLRYYGCTASRSNIRVLSDMLILFDEGAFYMEGNSVI